MGALATAIAAVIVALPAAAQTPPINYVVNGPYAATCAPLTSPTTVSGVPVSGKPIAVTLPFDFTYYENAYSSVNVNMHGYIDFGSGGNTYSTNYGIPHNYTGSIPSVFLAPWWDYLNMTSGSAIRYKTDGAAPNRVFTLEWANMCNGSTCTTSRFTFRVELHEKANSFRFHYCTGTASGSASVGYMNGQGVGKAVLSCTNASSGSCSSTAFPANSYFEMALPADVVFAGVSNDDVGYAGVALPVSVSIKNNGGLEAQGTVVRFFLSQDAVYDASDVAVGDTTPIAVDVGETEVASGAITVPTGTLAGEHFLIPVLDPDSAIAEGRGETNNVGVPAIFNVGDATPDLAVTSVTGPSTASAGQVLTVERTIENLGNDDAAVPVNLTWFVSDNAVVTISDVPVGEETVAAIAAGGTDTATAEVTLPTTLHAGKYWLGACVDYDADASTFGALPEISEVNNCATGTSFVLNTGALAVVTSSLPAATQNAPYGLRLEAVGGNGIYAWSVASGSLPVGMTLTEAGDLGGTPSEFGSFTFVVKVTSDGAEAQQSYTLMVTDMNMPLAVVDQTLPTGEFGRAYQWQLIAVGGKPPYVWSLAKDARLPQGLGLSPDGFIEGRPSQTQAEPFAFTVEVKDGLGARAVRTLLIRVVKPASMQIATAKLLPAFLKKEYRQPLQAIGGAAPYAWSVVRFQKLAQTSTEVPGEILPGIPDTFGIVVQKEGDNAVLRGVPTQAGLYLVSLYVQDRDGVADSTTLALNVSYDQALAITTTVLPDAFVNEPYTVRLSHNAGTEVTVDFTEACVQQVESTSKGFTYKCASVEPLQKLPAGLQLGTDGTISGTASAPEGMVAPEDASAEPPPVIHNFLVKATDANGRVDVRSLSIKVRMPPADKGGCSGTGLGPAALALLALAGIARRRRP